MFLGCSLKETPMMFITQYMPGGDLERYYRKKSEKLHSPWRPDLKTLTRWASQILRALHFLHTCSKPIIHRDLKPLNILLTDTMDVKVSDFGISKIKEVRERKLDKEYGESRRRSRAGSVVSAQSLYVAPARSTSLRSVASRARVQSTYMMTGGVWSSRYMAAEVARHQAYSEKVDIFSFALILYFMSSGRQPFCDFCEPIEILQQYTMGNEPRPRASHCPAVIRPIMQRAWHADPKLRPSALDLLRDTVDVQAKCTTSCRPM
eukprot:TRINITY_DN10653_c0_g2_i1.p1 TRINITY_DN10653_c0_g2~~TRINITY_DN10653_c0_g2_i1.p1  ORF type:complete len:263 (-),score=15.73 TRINITY_DN10653_c0_g2_i1:119-907(-)